MSILMPLSSIPVIRPRFDVKEEERREEKSNQLSCGAVECMKIYCNISIVFEEIMIEWRKINQNIKYYFLSILKMMHKMNSCCISCMSPPLHSHLH